MKKLNEEQKAEIKKYYSAPNTLFGLLALIGAAGALLALIGIVCPFFSYNPTVLDVTKRTVSFFELPAYAILGILFPVTAVMLTAFMPTLAVQENKRRSGNIILMLSLLCALLTVVAIAIVEAAGIIGYVIPEEDVELFTPVVEDAGAIMFIVGGILFCVSTVCAGILYKLCLCGAFDVEKLILFNREKQTAAGRNNPGSAAGGVQSELAEWKKLPDEGAITRGEYEEKKNGILHGRTDGSDWHA